MFEPQLKQESQQPQPQPQPQHLSLSNRTDIALPLVVEHAAVLDITDDVIGPILSAYGLIEKLILGRESPFLDLQADPGHANDGIHTRTYRPFLRALDRVSRNAPWDRRLPQPPWTLYWEIVGLRSHQASFQNGDFHWRPLRESLAHVLRKLEETWWLRTTVYNLSSPHLQAGEVAEALVYHQWSNPLKALRDFNNNHVEPLCRKALDVNSKWTSLVLPALHDCLGAILLEFHGPPILKATFFSFSRRDANNSTWNPCYDPVWAAQHGAAFLRDVERVVEESRVLHERGRLPDVCRQVTAKLSDTINNRLAPLEKFLVDLRQEYRRRENMGTDKEYQHDRTSSSSSSSSSDYYYWSAIFKIDGYRIGKKIWKLRTRLERVARRLERLKRDRKDPLKQSIPGIDAPPHHHSHQDQKHSSSSSSSGGGGGGGARGTLAALFENMVRFNIPWPLWPPELRAMAPPSLRAWWLKGVPIEKREEEGLDRGKDEQGDEDEDQEEY